MPNEKKTSKPQRRALPTGKFAISASAPLPQPEQVTKDKQGRRSGGPAKKTTVALAAVLGGGLVGVSGWLLTTRGAQDVQKHTAETITTAPAAGASAIAAQRGLKSKSATAATAKAPARSMETAAQRSVHVAFSAYRDGNYSEAERLAAAVLQEDKGKPVASGSKTAKAAKTAKARARYIQAFATARRGDLALARTRFALLKTEAATLPNGGFFAEAAEKTGGITNSEMSPQASGTLRDGAAPSSSPSASLSLSSLSSQSQKQALPRRSIASLEENAAYQHAVCTSALGQKAEAEREFVEFMRAYPESPLLPGVVKRITRFHGGNLPTSAEAVWQKAVAVAGVRSRERQRLVSLCGPECLAELLRRRNSDSSKNSGLEADNSVLSLAREMRTSDQGTTLGALARVAKRRGFPQARGVMLSQKGLKRQQTPLVTLVAPGHYVVVEKIEADGGVVVWDSSGNASGNTATALSPPSHRRAYSAQEWARIWSGGEQGTGVALTLLGGGRSS